MYEMSEKSRASDNLKRFWFSDIGFSSILFVTLGDSEQVGVGTEIFVFGYPGNLVEQKLGNKRNFEFSPGYLTSRLPNHPRLYFTLQCYYERVHEWRACI